MKTQIYLIRHGETQWNRERRLQGQLDSPLTEEGIQQAHALADKLSRIGFCAVYSSDLDRARRTTHIIISRCDQMSVTYDSRIRERHFGKFQGLTWQEVSEKYPVEAAGEFAGDPMNQAPGGESKHQLLNRAMPFFNEIADRHAAGKVLVISHGGVLNVWTKFVLQLPLEIPRRFHLANAAVNIFEYDEGNWYLKTLGERV